jgi:hypothetical protein
MSLSPGARLGPYDVVELPGDLSPIGLPQQKAAAALLHGVPEHLQTNHGCIIWTDIQPASPAIQSHETGPGHAC